MKRFLSFIIVLICIISAYSQKLEKASFYARKFHGRRTASGILYHKDSLTCAHRTLPFGTLLEITNPLNKKTVVVKVTDRGPRHKNRAVDLSLAAAQHLDIVRQGIALVRIQPWTHKPFMPIELTFDRSRLLIPVKNPVEIFRNKGIEAPMNSPDPFLSGVKTNDTARRKAE